MRKFSSSSPLGLPHQVAKIKMNKSDCKELQVICRFESNYFLSFSVLPIILKGQGECFSKNTTLVFKRFPWPCNKKNYHIVFQSEVFAKNERGYRLTAKNKRF